MAGAKSSLVVLCFLLIIATSQAASCKYSACYWACRKLHLSKAFCAKKCHCSLPSAFFPNELETKEAVLEEMVMMEELSLNDCPTSNVEMTEAMTAEEMEVDCNLAEAVLEEMMTEELSLNESPTFAKEMTEALTAEEMEDDYNLAEAVLEEMMMMMMEEPSLNECPTCKVKVTEALAAAEMAVDNNRAEAVLEEMMMMEEVISFNDKLTAKCKYNPCYRACRALGGSKDFCAKKCRCTQATDMVPVSPPSEVMAFKFILAVALVSVIIGIILLSRKKAIPISCFIKIWNIFIGIISFRVKKENKRQEDEKADNKKELVAEEKQSLLPASPGTAQVAAQAQEDLQGQRSIRSDPHKRLDTQPLVDPEASTSEEDGTLVPAASTAEEAEGNLVPAASLPE